MVAQWNTMEYWNNGIILFTTFPQFHHSNHKMFRLFHSLLRFSVRHSAVRLLLSLLKHFPRILIYQTEWWNNGIMGKQNFLDCMHVLGKSNSPIFQPFIIPIMSHSAVLRFVILQFASPVVCLLHSLRHSSFVIRHSAVHYSAVRFPSPTGLQPYEKVVLRVRCTPGACQLRIYNSQSCLHLVSDIKPVVKFIQGHFKRTAEAVNL